MGLTNQNETLFHHLLDWVKQSPSAPAQRYKFAGKWMDITVKEYADRVFQIALYLESRGLKKGDISCIFSYNCYQWAQFDLAPSLIGARSAGIYPNSATQDIDYILDHTQAKVLCVQNEEYYRKCTAGRGIPDSVELVVVFQGSADFAPNGVTYDEVLKEGKKLARDQKMKDRLASIDPHEPGFFIYTSGTTGLPKGAMLSQNNLVSAGEIILTEWKIPKGGEELFSFLPLSHIAEKVHNLSIGIWGRFTVNFCSSFDVVSTEIVEVKPTILLSVPRLWEKMKEGVEAKLVKAPLVKQKLAKWALQVGERVAKKRFSGEDVGLSDIMEFKLADKLVLSKIKEALGFSNLKIGATGAAPISQSVVWFFRKLGLDLVELYGLTETSAVCTFNTPGVDGAGTVGKPAPGTEFKIASDEEILTKGPCVFKGYYKNEEATKESIDSEGWFHTGDLGKIIEGGFVKIIGRKRDILKTSGGKMVAPVGIEEKLKESDMISQVCMVGDNRKYFSALVTLTEDALKSVADHKDDEVVKDPIMIKSVQEEIDKVNSTLASFEQIKKFKIINREFSIEKGEMTPTLKMKRANIEKSFKSLIDGMYL